jgi:hypothetical protein
MQDGQSEHRVSVDEGALRTERLEHGLELLRQTLFAQTERLQRAIAERDHIIVSRQTELTAAIEERDTLIVQLQDELHAKVAERDAMIVQLQNELHSTYSKHDRPTRAPQPEDVALNERSGESASDRTPGLPVTQAPDELEEENAQLREELNRIHQLRIWKLLTPYWRLRERLRGGSAP